MEQQRNDSFAYQDLNADRSGPPEIRPEEITFEELIGTGSFGKVFKGRCRQKAVAVKLLHKQNYDSATLAAFRKEVHLMSKIYHPNICLFMGACTIPGKCVIVTELVPKGNLETLLHDEKIQLPLYLRMKMAKDAALGINWLHESNPVFVHRDVKSSNLLVDENMKVKICDFGLSALKQKHKMLKDQSSAKGTPLYMAPEVMMFKEFNESSDVYSFGIVLWEILTRKEPFSHHRELEKFREAVCSKHERPPIPADCLDSLRKLIEKCWDKEPLRRPSFKEIIATLDHIIVDAAISDINGRDFWKRSFLTEQEVPWDTFVDALCEWSKHPNRTQCDKASIEYQNIKCLKAILSDSPKAEGTGVDNIVHIEKFGKILEFFGPMNAPNEGKTLLELIREVMAQKWFHGYFETVDAATRLGGQPVGSFLIRFSSTNAGCFTISQVINEAGTIKHQRVSRIGTKYNYQNVNYNSLIDVVAKNGGGNNGDVKLDASLGVPNFKFMALFCHVPSSSDTY
ncbi:hypothetical protein SAMD00019534_098780 [Acytostelium subglobosum LB1]|uniref:hypothetical protein n=1 Tax=Acytostelium subglobosum LB1 TaxID=1410327 RepID=UPI000644FD4D|nr:hypothetical protein SAMD00019534_098780 [Acytostelium subglobosum LB1]GAM26703.1 hypothetical protein SAMD00019534_098780 [Acytostelium subglobosum LB1]|eukprot:XP_012750364.1 hypothetical protein SAMD00019534_098780 [Acytostelium subglobosum LB1]